MIEAADAQELPDPTRARGCRPVGDGLEFSGYWANAFGADDVADEFDFWLGEYAFLALGV